MTVYVDTMKAKYGRMVMCHMIADSHDELHKMADRIGIKRKWFQRDHYDICLSKKKKALDNGAMEVSMYELAAMCKRLKIEGACGRPEDAVDWFKGYMKDKCK